MTTATLAEPLATEPRQALPQGPLPVPAGLATPAGPAGSAHRLATTPCATVMPVATLNHIHDRRRYAGPVLNRAVLEFYGLFVVEGALKACIGDYVQRLLAFKASGGYVRSANHLTEVKLAPDNPLTDILDEPALVTLAEQLFPRGAGLYGIRLVKKDATDRSPVFLHQDIAYHHGTAQRYSLFVPLTRCGADNGGLEFIPGTHQFGHLGDAGEINAQAIPPGLKTLTPTVVPGDVVVMDSALWHRSGPNVSGTERICYDIHINTLNDPATSRGLGGRRPDGPWRLDYAHDQLFSNSRSQRLRRFYERDEQQAAGKA